MTQNTTDNVSTTTEPILSEERLGRWLDMFDEAFGINQPKPTEK